MSKELIAKDRIDNAYMLKCSTCGAEKYKLVKTQRLLIKHNCSVSVFEVHCHECDKYLGWMSKYQGEKLDRICPHFSISNIKIEQMDIFEKERENV